MHHIATIRRPWPLIPEDAATVSHTGSEDSLVSLLPTSTASSLAFAPQQLGGMHDCHYTETTNELTHVTSDPILQQTTSVVSDKPPGFRILYARHSRRSCDLGLWPLAEHSAVVLIKRPPAELVINRYHFVYHFEFHWSMVPFTPAGGKEGLPQGKGC